MKVRNEIEGVRRGGDDAKGNRGTELEGSLKSLERSVTRLAARVEMLETRRDKVVKSAVVSCGNAAPAVTTLTGVVTVVVRVLFLALATAIYVVIEGGRLAREEVKADGAGYEAAPADTALADTVLADTAADTAAELTPLDPFSTRTLFATFSVSLQALATTPPSATLQQSYVHFLLTLLLLHLFLTPRPGKRTVFRTAVAEGILMYTVGKAVKEFGTVLQSVATTVTIILTGLLLRGGQSGGQGGGRVSLTEQGQGVPVERSTSVVYRDGKGVGESGRERGTSEPKSFDESMRGKAPSKPSTLSTPSTPRGASTPTGRGGRARSVHLFDHMTPIAAEATVVHKTPERAPLTTEAAASLTATPVVNHDTGEQLDLMEMEAMNAQFHTFADVDGGEGSGGSGARGGARRRSSVMASVASVGEKMRGMKGIGIGGRKSVG